MDKREKEDYQELLKIGTKDFEEALYFHNYLFVVKDNIHEIEGIPETKIVKDLIRKNRGEPQAYINYYKYLIDRYKVSDSKLLLENCTILNLNSWFLIATQLKTLCHAESEKNVYQCPMSTEYASKLNLVTALLWRLSNIAWALSLCEEPWDYWIISKGLDLVEEVTYLHLDKIDRRIKKWTRKLQCDVMDLRPKSIWADKQNIYEDPVFFDPEAIRDLAQYVHDPQCRYIFKCPQLHEKCREKLGLDTAIVWVLGEFLGQYLNRKFAKRLLDIIKSACVLHWEKYPKLIELISRIKNSI